MPNYPVGQRSTISVGQLHAGQIRAHRALLPHRFKALRCGRRFGKTEFAAKWIAQGLLQRQKCAWFAPQHMTWSEVFVELSRVLAPLVVASSKADGVLRLANEGRLDFWSLENRIAAALDKHPGLARVRPGEVEGEMRVHAVYDGVEINDIFKVRISKSNPHSKRVPALREMGGRTNAILAKYGITDSRTLHRNDTGVACVCTLQEEAEKFPAGSGLLDFIDRLARDYLYGLAFYDLHYRWLWGERSHGILGLLEFYADNVQPQSARSIDEVITAIRKETDWREYSDQLRKPNGDRPCPCGSGKPFKACHHDAWAGLLRLRVEIDRLRIRPRSLFDRAVFLLRKETHERN